MVYFFICSSLLIVYEGNGGMPYLNVSKQSCCSTSPMFCVSDCTQESDNSRDVPCCYDADTSNSSLDLSHDDVSQDSHHRGFGEAAARGAKSGNFFPISEETMFLDDAPSMQNIAGSSPLVDSWVMYSNSSSDEYSLSGQYQGACSNDDGSDFEMDSPHKNKTSRSCASLQFEDLMLEDEDDEEIARVSRKSVPKRLRVKDPLFHPSSSSRSRSPTPIQVDVRMIDFAHTSFIRKSSDPATTCTTVHHGPDGGFLTGLDSLKRLLLQIVEEA